jgi:ribosomal protein L32E
MNTKKKPKFLRKDVHKMSKLGKGRKNKQKWKKPTGRDNKMREKKKGHRKVVSIGYKADKSQRDTINEKKPVYIETVKQLEKIQNNEIAILGRVGQKRKIEIAKAAEKAGIKISNLNIKKFLKEVGFKSKKKKVENKKDDKKTESKKETKENKENKK